MDIASSLALAGICGGSFVVALSGAMMPGPLLTVTIVESSRRGALTGPFLMAGHALLEIVMVAALLMGLGPVLSHDAAAIVLGLAGGVALTWMSVGIFRGLPSLRLVSAAEGKPVHTAHRNRAFTGILMSLANPYWTLWWATIGLGYLNVARAAGVPGVVAFFCGHIAGDIVWYTAVSWSVARGSRLMSTPVYRTIMALCASALLGFAAWFAWGAVARFTVWSH